MRIDESYFSGTETEDSVSELSGDFRSWPLYAGIVISAEDVASLASLNKKDASEIASFCEKASVKISSVLELSRAIKESSEPAIFTTDDSMFNSELSASHFGPLEIVHGEKLPSAEGAIIGAGFELSGNTRVDDIVALFKKFQRLLFEFSSKNYTSAPIKLMYIMCAPDHFIGLSSPSFAGPSANDFEILSGMFVAQAVFTFMYSHVRKDVTYLEITKSVFKGDWQKIAKTYISSSNDIKFFMFTPGKAECQSEYVILLKDVKNSEAFNAFFSDANDAFGKPYSFGISLPNYTVEERTDYIDSGSKLKFDDYILAIKTVYNNFGIVLYSTNSEHMKNRYGIDLMEVVMIIMTNKKNGKKIISSLANLLKENGVTKKSWSEMTASVSKNKNKPEEVYDFCNEVKNKL